VLIIISTEPVSKGPATFGCVSTLLVYISSGESFVIATYIQIDLLKLIVVVDSGFVERAFVEIHQSLEIVDIPVVNIIA
jgi:hypothetical protein